MDSITSNLAAIVLVLAGLCLVLMLVLQAMQISQLRQRLDRLTRGSDGESLEAVIGAHLETVHEVGRDLDELTAKTAVLESSARHHFTHLGLVRFNPFPDTGGNQSFALALLDESEDGFVISSLHSRTGTRIYAKAVVGGKADTSLSTEENEAMDQARSRRPARPATAAERAIGARAASQASAPVPAGPSAAATTAKAAPAPSPKLAPAPAPAEAPATAPVKTAAPVGAPAREYAGGGETTDPKTGTKGQSKGKEAAVAGAGSTGDPERTGRKPGRLSAAEPIPSPNADTPGS